LGVDVEVEDKRDVDEPFQSDVSLRRLVSEGEDVERGAAVGMTTPDFLRFERENFGAEIWTARSGSDFCGVRDNGLG
jgi:hypothetical protein